MTLRVAPEPESAEADRPAEAPSPSGPGWRRALLLWGAVPGLLFLGGGLASWCAVHRHASHPEATEEPPEPTQRSVSAKPAEPEELGDRLGRADQWLREQRFSAALTAYRELLRVKAERVGPLHYRAALCQEGLGNTDKALASYRLAVSDPLSLAVHFPAHLAQARLLLRSQKAEQAALVLYPLLLAEPTFQVPAHLQNEARCLLALALAQQALTPPPSGSLLAQFLLPPPLPVYIPVEAAELDMPEPKEVKQAAAHEEVLATQQPVAGGETMLLRARCVDQSAASLFELLAKSAGLKQELTTGAARALQERSLRLVVHDRPLADVILTSADALGLCCHMDASVLHLVTAQEATPAQRQAFRQELARRWLRGTLSKHVEQRLEPALRLHLAYQELASGKSAEAISWCDKVVRETPAAPLALLANHNLGLLHAERGDAAAARKAFFRQIDMAPGHTLAPLAYLHIGRLYLEDRQFERAVLSLRRAQDGSPVVHTTATLNLAAAHLSAGEPGTAAALLAQQRRFLLQEPYRATAAFLDALASQRLAREERAARWESAQLVAALARTRDDQLLGPVGLQLRGEAYGELGLWQEAAALYEVAIPLCKGPRVQDLQLAQAAALLQLHRNADASRLLQTLAAGAESPWAERAALRLAELDLQQEHPADCARRCAQLWRKPGSLAATDVLRLWGTALERLGENDKAARCFAGDPPD